MIKYIDGDLIKLAKENKFDIIIHGCNCFCTMGGGIAKQIKVNFPLAFEKDQKTIKGDRDKLGSISYVYDGDHKLIIINAYTQYDFDTSTRCVDYDAVKRCFKTIFSNFGKKGYKFALPKIGSGLAGGDWSIIEKIIRSQCNGENITIVNYSRPERF